MKRFFVFCLATCLIFSELASYQGIESKPTDLSEEAWDAVVPYLMEPGHPAYKTLSTIFNSARVVDSLDSIRDAGFVLTPQQGVHVHATTHPKLKGYVIKMYTDTNPERDWFKWSQRCKGAELIRASIAKFGFSKLFKVPKKWIYILPTTYTPSPSADIYPKHFVLVVEDMRVLPPKENRKRYRGKHMHKTTLDALVTIIEDLGLHDAIRCNNVPFCKDGKLAFVDTESWHRWPVWFHPMKEFLCPGMMGYWEMLTANPRQGP